MSNLTIRRGLVLAAGLVLLLLPLFVRAAFWGYHRRPYAPSELPSFSVAATPQPTVTPWAQTPPPSQAKQELRPGPVIVDMAHGNRVSRNQFEPLAAALARRGVGIRFWMSDIDPMTVTNFLAYPDQSEELAPLLRDASALVAASPFFLWSKAEIALVERFVADGGRLLLISDPNVVGDLAQDINNLAEPFGIVFADDYLYDTVENDGNHVYVFQTQFEDQAAELAGRRIAFYGARSISGEVTPQIRTAPTTLSALREGTTGLTTAALGGLASRGTLGGVLAMSDIDVMTAPFVERHDNAFLTEFVTDFLVSGERTNSVTDFPAYLGKHVTLVFANAAAVDAPILLEGSRLQQSLEASGRTLSLGGTALLTTTLAGGDEAPDEDLIVLADFAMAEEATTLLADFGFTLVTVESTPAPEDKPGEPETETETVTATPVPPQETETAEPAGADSEADTGSARWSTPVSPRGQFLRPASQGAQTETPEALLTPTATFTSLPETPAPTATPGPTSTPQPEIYLETADGLRLAAGDTVLVAQRQLASGHRLVVVLGSSNDGIRSGVDRLLKGQYDGCVTSADLAVCSGPTGEMPPATVQDGTATPAPAASETAPAPITPSPAPNGDKSARVLVIDDNDVMSPDEVSEADIYLQALIQAGISPALWTTAGDGIPTGDDLLAYEWVIWSSGGYESGGPGLADLDGLLTYINTGGNLTISSRRPFFGMSTEDPAVIADVTVDDDLPELARGLPSEPFLLENGLPPVVPLEISADNADARVALRRGPDSGSAGAPLLFLVTDENEPESTGARLLIMGMSLSWLPDEYDKQLVHNMAAVMLDDSD